MLQKKYDVIVIGGGHAGIEASFAVARRGLSILLVTTRREMIGHTPCNPSIGGSAKGIVVREIDALGGVMGKLADKSLLQMKMLNKSKGPAVWSLRSQIDVKAYPKNVQELLEEHPLITIYEDTVESLIIEEQKIEGVCLQSGKNILAQAVILTAGTYMDSAILVGKNKESIGPSGMPTSGDLSNNLKKLGFELLRLKTGTPARIKKDSIDYSSIEEQPGDVSVGYFSFDNEEHPIAQKQLSCYLTYANEKTIAIINEHLLDSAMYSGNVEGVGARYCPSIEDKIVRFSDKKRHQVFIEPESTQTDSMYVQGMSTSMPHDIQLKMLHSIEGLENCEVIQYGYAIEYDAMNPIQLNATLETKLIKNFYTAGQVNGTSGYEEAAAQGLIAGINAANKIQKKDVFILTRADAYIGVMIDDLVTKGVTDPYRLLTSRAEYRLLLRHDNADIRLFEHACKQGMLSAERKKRTKTKIERVEQGLALFKQLKITPKKSVLDYLKAKNYALIHDGISASLLLRRPEIKIDDILNILEGNEQYQDVVLNLRKLPKMVLQQIEIHIKYEGYIQKAEQQVAQMKKNEFKIIPQDIDYQKVPNLALEAREKFALVQPRTLAQASRIPGVNAVDVTMLDLFLKSKKR